LNDEKVVLEDGGASGSQKSSNFFHSIGIDGGIGSFGRPEYLTTTIFEEKSLEEKDEESIEANDDFEEMISRYSLILFIFSFLII